MAEHVDRLPHLPGDVMAAGRVVRRAGYTIVKREALAELRQRLEAADAAIERVRKHAEEVAAMASADWEPDDVSQAVRAEMLRNARAIHRTLTETEG